MIGLRLWFQWKCLLQFNRKMKTAEVRAHQIFSRTQIPGLDGARDVSRSRDNLRNSGDENANSLTCLMFRGVLSWEHRFREVNELLTRVLQATEPGQSLSHMYDVRPVSQKRQVDTCD